MEKAIKNTSTMLEKLVAKEKTWDFCTIYLKNKPPVFVDNQTEVRHIGGPWIALQFNMAHPSPQTEQEAGAKYVMTSYIDTSEAYSIDFYKEQKIITGPGLVKV